MAATAGQDHALTLLVDIVNSSREEENGPGITLTAGGLVISGDLIPNWLWFAEVNKELEEANHAAGEEEEPADWEVIFSSYRETLKTMTAEQEAALTAVENLAPRYQEALQDADTTTFIHLRDARIFHPGQQPIPGNGMHWRGRLTEVSGWSLGKLGG